MSLLRAFKVGYGMRLGTLVFMLIQSLLGFLHRFVANVTGVTTGKHVFAIQVASHVVLVPGYVQTQPAAELAVLRPVRVLIHSVCQQDRVRWWGNRALLATLVILLTAELVLAQQLPGRNHGATNCARIVLGRQLVCFQVDSHVVFFVRHMLAEGAGELAIFSPGGMGGHHI